MGTWGISNFADDAAADYAADFREKLLQQARDIVAKMDAGELKDSFEPDAILYNIEILSTLAHHVDFGAGCNEFVGDVDLIEELKAKYLAFFDINAKEQFEPESETFFAERREYIVNTFDKYITVSDS